MSIQIAAQRLRPNEVKYAEESYDSIVWRCENPPSREEVENLAAEIANETVWNEFRRERNRRLEDCDWTQVGDAPVDSRVWAQYRQELRDLPENIIDPANPVWPTPPA